MWDEARGFNSMRVLHPCFEIMCSLTLELEIGVCKPAGIVPLLSLDTEYCASKKRKKHQGGQNVAHNCTSFYEAIGLNILLSLRQLLQPLRTDIMEEIIVILTLWEKKEIDIFSFLRWKFPFSATR